ncbi:MAG: glycoside hydrolase family 99-like domain-containing protein [Armatimonadota bacterium]
MNCLFMAAAIPLAFTAPAQGPAYKLKMRVDYTSDWTVVRLPDFLVPVASRVVLNEGKSTPRIRGTEIVRADMDESRCVVEYDLVQVGHAGDDLHLTIEKGDLGKTKATLSLVGVPGWKAEVENAGKVEGNERNPREFTVSVDGELYAKAERAEIAEPREPMVLTFYYPWYGSPDGPQRRLLHWGNEANHYASAHYPELGLYDSADPKVIQQHMDWARDCGIDAFVCSWWGHGDANDYVDVACQAIMKVAEKNDFPFTLYVERNQDVDQAVSDLRYVWQTYAQSPAFLTLDGKPCIFVYGRAMGQIGLEGWRKTFERLKADGIEYAAIADGFNPAYLDEFAGYHTYNPCGAALDDLAKTYERASITAHLRKRVFVATVLPGYDDTFVRTPGFKRDREGGAFYPKSWRTAAQADPDWIIITTWNEWHEGSEIEPSKEYGHKYLELTRRLARRWKESR